MTVLNDKYALSDNAILKNIGRTLRKHRLDQNKTQSRLASESGISRSALSELEHGKNSNILTLIQVLRSLNLLQLLDGFETKEKISPIQLAKLEKKKRLRARKSGGDEGKPLTNW